MSKGHKTCPQCQTENAARKMVCANESCNHEFVQGGQLKMDQRSKICKSGINIPRGKKLCSNCKKIVGIRCYICPACDHELIEGGKDKIAQRQAEKDNKEKSDIPRGNKVCVGCKELIGVRCHVCPKCEYEYIAGALAKKKLKEAALANTEGNGRGRKKSFIVNKDELQEVIKEVEGTHGFTSFSKLCECIHTSAWNRKNLPPLTTAVIRLRIEEFELEFKSHKRVRKTHAEKQDESVMIDSELDANVAPRVVDFTASPSLRIIGDIIGRKTNENKNIHTISIPAGYCLVKPNDEEIENPTKAGIITWANQVIVKGLDTNYFYLCSAIQYWSRDFWGLWTEHYKTVQLWLMQEFDPHNCGEWTEDFNDVPEEEKQQLS